jgi:hypothetical protein
VIFVYANLVLIVVAALVALPLQAQDTTSIIEVSGHKNMKKKPPIRTRNTIIILLLLLVLSLATKAQAKIGETVPELIKRFGSNYTESNGIYEFILKDVRDVRRLIVVVNGRSVTELYVFYAAPLNKNGEPPSDIVRGVLDKESPRDKWHEVVPPYGANYALQNRDDSVTALLRYSQGSNVWSLEVGYTWATAALNTPAPTVTPDPYPDTPVIAPTPDNSRPPSDCAIIAAQAYARLKPVTYWCQIIGVSRTYSNGESVKHAMVAYKYQPDGHVFVYDEFGARELETTEQDLDAITKGLQAGNVTVLALKFLTH